MTYLVFLVDQSKSSLLLVDYHEYEKPAKSVPAKFEWLQSKVTDSVHLKKKLFVPSGGVVLE